MFKRHLYELILAGKKTQTRRPLDKKGTRSPEVGKRVGIRYDYFHKTAAWILIKHKSRQRLGNVTVEDAFKEGFLDLDSFRAAWIEIYRQWQPKQIVWVYEFELATQGSASTSKPSQQATP